LPAAPATPAASAPALLFPDDPRTWSRAGEAKVLADLTKGLPSGSLTEGRREKKKWKVVSYAVEGFAGKALSAFRDTEAPEVRLPLETSGPHAVYVGVCTCSAGLDYADENGVRVKLINENVYRRMVCGADLTCYPSEVGNIAGSDTQDFHRWEHKEYTESLRALFAAKVHPLKVAREEARRQGSEFHVMIRPAGFMASYPFDEIFDSRFARAHPEWRCVDRDGTPTLHMSYAFPEVRKQVLDVLRESLAFEPEGVGYLFHRGMPMVLWEEPFLKEFRSRYGADAREVPEDDPRILDLRTEMVTTLLRETRALLDEVAAKQGRKKPYIISLSTFSTEPDNRRHGLDIGRWAQEGLADDVAVAFFAHHTSFKQPDMAYYRRLVDGTKTKLYPFVIAWNSGSPQQLCRRVTGFYAQGATGIAVWDPTVEAHYRDKSPGNVIDIASRVGRRELIADWSKRGPPQPPIVPLLRFGDNYYSRWFPNTGY